MIIIVDNTCIHCYKNQGEAVEYPICKQCRIKHNIPTNEEMIRRLLEYIKSQVVKLKADFPDAHLNSKIKQLAADVQKELEYFKNSSN